MKELKNMDNESLEEDREEENRLFSHWEAVANSHQVTLPPGESNAEFLPSLHY